MTARVRAAGPWLLTAAVCAVIVCATVWPLPTGWAVGCAIGAGALTHGVRMLRAETRPDAGTDGPACAGCIGCGGPDCVQHPTGYFDACPTPETHNWGCGCPTDQMGQQ